MKNSVRQLSFDDMIDALADVQRRKLLVSLLEQNPQEKAPVVITDSETDAGERLVTMHHIYLPKLAAYGLIEWDAESYEVERGPKFDEIKPLLELLVDHEDELPADWV